LDKYRVTSLIRKRTPQGPYRRHMPRVMGVIGGLAFFNGRSTPCTFVFGVALCLQDLDLDSHVVGLFWTKRSLQGYLAHKEAPPPYRVPRS
jgi:hypothetical protein